MGKSKVKGRFSTSEGSAVRVMYSDTGEYVGVIRKLPNGTYKVLRRDGKIRIRQTLDEAKKTIARKN